MPGVQLICDNFVALYLLRFSVYYLPSPGSLCIFAPFAYSVSWITLRKLSMDFQNEIFGRFWNSNVKMKFENSKFGLCIWI